MNKYQVELLVQQKIRNDKIESYREHYNKTTYLKCGIPFDEVRITLGYEEIKGDKYDE